MHEIRRFRLPSGDPGALFIGMTLAGERLPIRTRPPATGGLPRPSWRSVCRQLVLDGGDDFRSFRLGESLEPVHDLALAVDEELGEVPLNVPAEFRIARLIRQVAVERRLAL